MYKKQAPKKCLKIIEDQLRKFEGGSLIDPHKKVPKIAIIPTEQSNRWIEIKDVICVYVDMKNSTKLNADLDSKYGSSVMPSFYTLFTGTAVRFFDYYGATYVDIKGDGVFALFNANQIHRSLAAAVSFKTFVETVFNERVKKLSDVETGVHIGIHQSNLLVSKVGLRKDERRADMHNEVWAGDAVNFSSKLAGLCKNNEICISSHFHGKLTHESAKITCKCSNSFFSFSDKRVDLWEEIDLTHDPKIPLSRAFKTEFPWCSKHGRETSTALLKADNRVDTGFFV